MTPIGAAARGAIAGAIGTLAMDLLWFSRYKRDGGEAPFVDWELSAELHSWEEAPAPAQIGKRLVEGLLRRDLPARRARLVNNTMHWAYGTFWGAQYGILAAAGAQYGILAAAGRGRRRAWHGAAFGALVWASDYVVLPAAGVYKPVWEYDRATLARDLSAHLVFGVTADGALRLLARDA